MTYYSEIITIGEIKLRTWRNNHRNALVIVGGDGDTNKTFVKLVERMLSEGLELDVVTITFQKGIKTITPSLKKQAEDLIEIIEYLRTQKYHSVNIFCTSDGAYSTVNVLSSNKFPDLIKKIIYLDSADYYLTEEETEEPDFIWSGYESFKPQDKVSSDLMQQIEGDVKMDVVHLSVKKYSKDGYSPDRANNNAGFYSRLNKDMVYAFYEKTPMSNRGSYTEIDLIPHAFMRDGDVEKNIKRLSKYVLSSLES